MYEMYNWSWSGDGGGGLGGKVDSGASEGQSRAPQWAGSAHEIRVQKQNYDCDVVVEVAPHASVYFFQVGVPHFPLLRCFLQRDLHQPPSASLKIKKNIYN